MNTLIKNLQAKGFQIWFTDRDSFDIMDFHITRIFANVKKGAGRKVLIKSSLEDEYTVCNSQKEATQWFLDYYEGI